jgi:N6-adenosine-specific RNA methylase IME4
MNSDVFQGLRGDYGVIYADAPLRFKTYDNATTVVARATQNKSATVHYHTMSTPEIMALPVADLAAKDSVLLLWTSPPFIEISLEIVRTWGFKFKTFAFVWVKADPLVFFAAPSMGMGYWTRSNAEFVLLATRGHPKRLHADVSQIVIERRRQHSRKPDLYDRIERLVAGPYVELFARQTRPGWDCWGDQTTRFNTTPIDAQPEEPTKCLAQLSLQRSPTAPSPE